MFLYFRQNVSKEIHRKNSQWLHRKNSVSDILPPNYHQPSKTATRLTFCSPVLESVGPQDWYLAMLETLKSLELRPVHTRKLQITFTQDRLACGNCEAAHEVINHDFSHSNVNVGLGVGGMWRQGDGPLLMKGVSASEYVMGSLCQHFKNFASSETDEAPEKAKHP